MPIRKEKHQRSCSLRWCFLFYGKTGIARFYLPHYSSGDLRWPYLSLYVFTSRGAKPATSGGDIFRCTFFTYRSTFPTPSGGTIFLCLKKDSGERRTSSSQAPHPSFCLSGQKLSRSAAPPLPTKPTSLGFGGAPIGGPLNPQGLMLTVKRTCFVPTTSQWCI